MHALVVFESMFGNTQAIANAVAAGLSSQMTVDVVEVDRARTVVSDVDLLVVGGPTHAFGLSRERTRVDAVGQAGALPVSTSIGLRDWLAVACKRSPSVAAATFDTRITKPRVPGSAARAAHRRLRRLGFDLIAPAESFYVEGTPGPLLDGELERARQWGDSLASELVARDREQTPSQ